MGTVVLPAVNCRVMLALPTVEGLVESRKWAGSLLVRVSFSLEGGAAAKRMLFAETVLLPTIIGLPLKLIVGTGPTLMGAVIVVIPGEDTLRFAVPCATPVTANVTLSWPGGTVTLAGTVAAAVLSDERLNTMPAAGAAAEMDNVTFVVLVAFTLIELGLSESVTVTVTAALSGANPAAVAVTCVAPIATPVTCGFAAGMNRPAGTKTLGEMVATELLALAKLMVNPLAGAAKDKLTGKLPLCPGANVGMVPKLIRLLVTASGAVALV